MKLPGYTLANCTYWTVNGLLVQRVLRSSPICCDLPNEQQGRTCEDLRLYNRGLFFLAFFCSRNLGQYSVTTFLHCCADPLS
ncbi:MAG: hypothetical protein [Circular genetic element sp.]|nr:MAG: hypothetical protein [Circular genetic element sp.]